MSPLPSWPLRFPELATASETFRVLALHQATAHPEPLRLYPCPTCRGLAAQVARQEKEGSHARFPR